MLMGFKPRIGYSSDALRFVIAVEVSTISDREYSSCCGVFVLSVMKSGCREVVEDPCRKVDLQTTASCKLPFVMHSNWAVGTRSVLGVCY